MAEPTYEELKARLAEMEKKGAGRRTGEVEFKVGEKGGVSVYGLGRFPVTLYYEQWVRLLDTGEKLPEFLEENKTPGKLKLKERSIPSCPLGGNRSSQPPGRMVPRHSPNPIG